MLEKHVDAGLGREVILLPTVLLNCFNGLDLRVSRAQVSRLFKASPAWISCLAGDLLAKCCPWPKQISCLFIPLQILDPDPDSLALRLL